MDAYNKITSAALSVKVPLIDANLKQQTLTPPNRPSLLSVPGINCSSEVDNIEVPLSDGRLGIIIVPYIHAVLLILMYRTAPLLVEHTINTQL